MRELAAKVCLLGEFAVGKTSTVERFVNNQFSEKYLTTIGVKVDTRNILLPGNVNLKLVLWDVAGTNRFGDIEFAYLRGASGLLFVADGTRADTADTALDLKRQCDERYPDTPTVMLLNKSDLTDMWEISPEMERSLQNDFGDLFITSAKNGDNVDDAIQRLGMLIAERDFSLQL